MKVTISPNDDTLDIRNYHVNPHNVVGVYECKGVFYMDTTDGGVYRIDRDSYDRIVTWIEAAR